jgi:hypothetical protein
MSGTGNLTNSGTIAFTGAGRLTLVGSLLNTGTLTLLSTPVYFAGTNTAASTVSGFTTTGLVSYGRTAGSTTFTGDVNGAALTISATGGTVNLGANLNHTFTGLVTLTAGTMNGQTSTLNANFTGGTAWSKATAFVFTPSTGTIELGGAGAQSIGGAGATTFYNLTLAGSGTKTISLVPTINGVLSMEGTAALSASPTFGASSTIQYKGTSSKTMGVEFPNAFNGSGGVIIDQDGYIITANANKTALTGNLKIRTGTLDLSTFTMNSAASGDTLVLESGGHLIIGGTLTLPSNYTNHRIAASSTVEYDGTNQTVTTPNSSQTYGNLILSGSGTKTLQSGVSSISGDFSTVGSISTALPANMTFNGNVVLGSGTTVSTGAYTHSLKGNFENNGSTFTTTGSTLDFSGTAAQTIGGSASTTFNNLTISNSTRVSMLIGETINGTLTVGSGAAYTTGAYGHSLKGNLLNNGSTFDATGSTLTFNGTSAQTIGGSSATTFENLTLNNTNGLTINTNQSLSGILTLSNGLLNTGSNTLTVDCSGSIANASAARYINGKLGMTFCSTGSKTFPIGKGGNYRPLTLNYTALTGSSIVTAEQIESILPGSIPSDIDAFASRYWQLSQSGGSGYSFKLTLDGTGWSPTSYLKMLKGDGSTNVHHSLTTPNYTNATGFTSFGNFGLGQLNCVTWLGTTSDWFTASNWTCESVPLGTDDIRIPSSVSFLPTISGTSPANDFSIAGTGKLQVLAGADVTLESGPLLTFQSGATVTTGVGSKIVLKSGARYLNLSSSTPTLNVQRVLTGSKGWRMLSAPVASTYSDLFKSPMVTQGFTGSSFPTLQPNLLWWLESDGGTSLQSWRQPTNLSDALVAGRGYFQYAFNGAGRLNLDGSSSGSNYPDVLPITVSATGVENFNGSGSFNYSLTYTTKSTSQTPSPTDTIYYDLNALDQGWNLLGNPTASTLDWDAVSGWTKTNVDNTLYIWDPSALSGNGDYLTWNGSTGTLGNGRIAPLQAFWTHATAATTLSFTNAVKTSTAGTFLRSTPTEEPIVLSLDLSVGDLKTTSFVSFSDRGKTGPDRWDGYRLESMSENRLDLYTLSSPYFVSPLVINNLPKIQNDLVSIPLYYEVIMGSAVAQKDISLSWTLPSNWPSEWNINLLNHRTQESISMLERSSYSFTTEIKKDVAPKIGSLPLPKTLLKPLSSNSKLRSTSSNQPFSIVVYKGSDIGYIPPKPQLVGSTTNPFRQSTYIRFSLPEKGTISLEVYSTQGKKIAVLAAGLFPAGITDIPWDASNLAPDLYLIRFVSGSTVDSKKAVLIQ